MRGEKDGYFTDKVSNGDSLGIYYMFHQEGSVWSRSFDYVCDTELPVYEDLPGGKVLYLVCISGLLLSYRVLQWHTETVPCFSSGAITRRICETELPVSPQECGGNHAICRAQRVIWPHARCVQQSGLRS